VDEAIECCRKAIALDPKHASSHSGLGVILCDIKRDYDGAIACFRQAIALGAKDALTHYNLGNALKGKGKVDEAIECYQKAIELDPKYPEAHTNLGLALGGKGKVDEAIECYQKAIALDPKLAQAHYNLANALMDRGKVDEAIGCYRQYIALAPKDPTAHYNLGNALMDRGEWDEAIACFKKAIELAPTYPEAHCNLGHILSGRGHFAEALAALKRGHELGTKRPGWPYPSAAWVREAERLAALEAKLPAFLKGEFQPSDTAQRLGLARVCQAKRLHAAAARLSADAFVSDPKVADDLQAGHRYDAACSAALAAAGQGEDAGLDDKERARLRKQALDWLSADLALYTKLTASGPANARSLVQQKLKHWQKDAVLAGVRDQKALARLPAEEQTACTQLWADVATLLKKAQTPTKQEDKQ
jgi:Flp pilus assembly protein TadD